MSKKRWINGSVNRHQRGIALLYMLLIFSIISLMATHIITSLLLNIEKHSQYIERIQAKHYAMAAEQYVSYLLETDFKEAKRKNRQVVNENQRWNTQTVDYKVEQGNIELIVIDEQGRFNINWLAYKGGAGDLYLKMFENLLLMLDMNIGLATQIKTWLGAASDSSNGAAADNFYLVLDPARRAANTEIVSTSELKLVQGITPEIFEKLAPFISALPKKSKLNINTSLPEVILSISDKITNDGVDAIIEGRGKEGYAKIAELHNITHDVDQIRALRSAPISFFSQYFSIYIKAFYRDTPFYLKTKLFRDSDGSVKVVGREIGPNSYWITRKKES